MVKRDVIETVFFILIFCLFCLAVKLSDMWSVKLGKNVSIMVTGIVFTCIIIGAYILAGLHKTTGEKFWDVSPGARCRGNWYNWQGSSKTAQMCRDLSSTPEGRAEIASYNCPTGTLGVPPQNFEYTPLSDDKWENERCKNEN